MAKEEKFDVDKEVERISRKTRVNIMKSERLFESRINQIRLILDRFSVEAFVNDGRQVLSAVLYTSQEADGISFACRGRARVDIEKYDLI